MSEVEQAKASLDAARRAMDEAQTAYREATGEWNNARALYAEAQSRAAPDHPLEGKIVGRTEHRRTGGIYNSRYAMVAIRGVVFTYRTGVDIGRGHYGITPGQPMVRLLKADGTPGKITQGFSSAWTLEEPSS